MGKSVQNMHCAHTSKTRCRLFDIFQATNQGLEECEPSIEETEPEDDQDEGKEQSLADSLPIRRQVARMLVRVSRLEGAKRRLVFATSKHPCGACEAQKRPVAPT